MATLHSFLQTEDNPELVGGVDVPYASCLLQKYLDVL